VNVRQAKPWKGGCRTGREAETVHRNPAGDQSRPTKVGHQSEPSLAWCRGDPGCEA